MPETDRVEQAMAEWRRKAGLLTTAEAAAALGLAESSVRTYAATGRLDRGGTHTCVTRESVEAYLANLRPAHRPRRKSQS